MKPWPSHQGRDSGWGFATGYAGSIAALLAAYPFVQAQSYGGAFLFPLCERSERARSPLHELPQS